MQERSEELSLLIALDRLEHLRRDLASNSGLQIDTKALDPFVAAIKSGKAQWGLQKNESDGNLTGTVRLEDGQEIVIEGNDSLAYIVGSLSLQ